ncbi:transporter substrate-binding domain-containing protein [Streptomyces sp. NPDC058613]|uniref:transporter substrate-binding domain-containing protein n=1 Tax=Streptomyces sp. NPDC058613 TaxID=3346556 RepID=UPI00365332A0
MNPTVRRCAVLTIALPLLLGGSCQPKKPDPTFLGKTQITAALHNDLPGMSYEENYQRSGLDWLVANQVRRGLKLKAISPVNTSSEGRVPALTGGGVDIVIASFSITPSRMKEIDFAGPYLTTRQGFLVGKDSARIRSLEDLESKRVCTWEGTTSDEALQDLKHIGVQPVTLADASDCIDELKAGQVDAISTDQSILYGFAGLYADDGLRVVPGLTIGAPQHYGVGLPKGHREDCRRLRDFLKEYVKSNEWIKDIETSLPEIPRAEPGWISDYKPSDSSIDARSCRDESSS